MKLQAMCLSGAVLASSLCGLLTSPTVTKAAPANVTASARVPQKLANVKLEVEPGHVINFREVEPGKVLISEQYNIDRHRSQLTGKLVERSTLPDLYRKLAPSLQVPQELVAAQQRKTAQLSQTRESAGKDQSRSQNLRGSQVRSLSSDGEWFLQNFCNYNLFTFCHTDQTYAWVTRSSVNYFEATGMAADSVSTAHFVGKYWSCGFLGFNCEWKTAWDYTVQPRWRHTHWWSSSGSYHAGIWGNNPYPHVHFAAMWR